MIKNFKIVIGYIIGAFILVFSLNALINWLFKTNRIDQDVYKQRVYDLEIPNRKCKAYFINVKQNEPRITIIDCGDTIFAGH